MHDAFRLELIFARLRDLRMRKLRHARGEFATLHTSLYYSRRLPLGGQSQYVVANGESCTTVRD